jgi:16S rRNA (adenine1518-N6/adenine1519-N6)-dimethyltransferase
MNPMNKKDVQLVLNRLDVKPKKNWGQNFLIDNNIASKIISESDISSQDTILEIGPGLGALTEDLIKSAKKVYLIEKEPKFCYYLSDKFSTRDNVEIINDDILKVDIPPHDKVVSNIPYTITGAILEKVFYKQNPPMGVISIEKNIAERIFLSNNYKKFSRISLQEVF